MNSQVYTVDWSILLRLLLPTRLRKPRILAFLNAAIEPIRMLYQSFLSFREASLYKVRFNSQIVYLEAVLNDQFDNELRRIRIENATFKPGLYLYEPEQMLDVFLYQSFMGDNVRPNDPPTYLTSFLTESGDFDFFVFVPFEPEASDGNLENRIKSYVNYYKLYAKNYQIIWGMN